MSLNYKAIILCGGLGSRYNQNKKRKILKPLVKINNIPMIERVMNIYKKQGVREFFLLGGYKFDDLKKFGKSYLKKFPKIKIKIIFTGIKTNTGGRLLKIRKHIDKKDSFFFTYGDSLASFNVKKALKEKTKNNYVISTYKYKLNYGKLDIKGKILKKINEKKFEIFINAGFYILDYTILEYIKKNSDSFEKIIINKVISKNRKKFKFVKLNHWAPMDNIYDQKKLESLLLKNDKLF